MVVQRSINELESLRERWPRGGTNVVMKPLL